MTDQSKQPHREGSHLASADRRTLDAIFHHPAAHNLGWMDALDLLTHLGSAEEKADGKYSLTINGKHVVFHKPHNKQLDAHEISELRHYLASAGISPQNPYGTPAATEPTSVDVVALVDHHGAKLYRVNLSSDQPAETVKPYDPYHFLHHLHHGDQLRERGQRAPEDLTFYDRIAEALRDADRIVLLYHGAGMRPPFPKSDPHGKIGQFRKVDSKARKGTPNANDMATPRETRRADDAKRPAGQRLCLSDAT